MKFISAWLFAVAIVGTASARDLTQSERTRIDHAVETVLHQTGAPGASIAIVLDGKIAMTKAYGYARLSPRLRATEDTRFALGSVSKQFTAALLLKLRDAGKLALEDKVDRYAPEIEHGGEMTVRQLLNHTSGLLDFWPHNFLTAEMRSPTTPATILQRWATGPLQYAPGTDWDYSNTGYAAAAVVAERVGGQPLFAQLQQHFFTPLGIHDAVDSSVQRPPESVGYTRYALGPARPADVDQTNWLIGSAGLAMTARDLALWDISMLDQSLLTADSYKQMFTPTTLPNGRDTKYGLGVNVDTVNERFSIEHGGQITGFMTENVLFPAERAAIAVLVNSDVDSPPQRIGQRLTEILFRANDKDRAVREFYNQLRAGKLETSRLTPTGVALFTPSIVADHQAQLTKFGEPDLFKFRRNGTVRGLDWRSYLVKHGTNGMNLFVRFGPDQKIEEVVFSDLAE
jgi:CubicO group peptidase (beta-lactamase class C family)